RSRQARWTAASRAAGRRRARASRASERRCPIATTARRISTLIDPRLWLRPRRPVGYIRSMSHDTAKLIRQLSLVTLLMAERRPLTARDVKANDEGYSEMSDE